MDTQRIAAKYRLSVWVEQVKERVASGQSIREYCKENKISPSTYYHRQKKVREAACTAMMREESPTQLIASAPPMGEMLINTPVGWTQLTEVKESTEPVPHIAVEIGKSKIIVTQSTDTELLVKACQVLMQLC